jgi:dTDP-4-amino-4,6-dideoxygalactose transaminase
MQDTSPDALKLAINGGSPAVTSAPIRLPRWGANEERKLLKMITQKSLFYWNNEQTTTLLSAFREHYPFDYIMPCSSCSAALHIAVAAIGLRPGDEVITSAVTDMGTVIGVLFQQGVPVFADLDATTYNMDPESVRANITPRTRAIIAVHFNGNPCDMDALVSIAKEHNLLLIEDCAQAWGALHNGQPVGMAGDVACYSFDDFKHLSCGDGGLVCANDPTIGKRLQPFGDKGYDRVAGGRNPTVLAANYRISEPQAAVAAGQLEGLAEMATGRARMGKILDDALEGIPGIIPPAVDPRHRHAYWFYAPKLERGRLRCDRDTFVKAIQAEGVLANDGSFASTTYQWEVFQKHAFFGGEWPLRDDGKTDMDYTKVHCPVAEELIQDWFRLIIFEGMTEQYLLESAAAIRKVAQFYSAG